jgi:hypothetical protein
MIQRETVQLDAGGVLSKLKVFKYGFQTGPCAEHPTHNEPTRWISVYVRIRTMSTR